jgi:hypothetical protein
MYVSEGCQPANRVYYVDLAALSERKPDGSVDWTAYDFKTGQYPPPSTSSNAMRGCLLQLVSQCLGDMQQRGRFHKLTCY